MSGGTRNPTIIYYNSGMTPWQLIGEVYRHLTSKEERDNWHLSTEGKEDGPAEAILQLASTFGITFRRVAR